MDIPSPDMDPESASPSANNKFGRGATRVVFRRIRKVIRWVFRAALSYKLYCISLVSLVTVVALSWDFFFRSYRIGELAYLSPACQNKSEYEIKAASEMTMLDASAASTLMTLLPALLVFVPFPTARISSFIVFSTSAALLTTSVTLGLATSNISTLPRGKRFRVVDLCTKAAVRYYAVMKDPRGAVPQLYLPGPILDLAGGDEADHSISSSLLPRFPLAIAGVPLQNRSGNTLRDIMLQAVGEGNRPARIWLDVVTFGFFLIQACLVFLLLHLVPDLIQIDLFWLCEGFGNQLISLWLGITMVLAGVIRTFVESTKYSKVEILHLRPLSRSFIFEPCQNCASANTFSQRASGPAGNPESHNRNIRPGFHGSFWPGIFEYPARIASFSRRLRIAQQSQHGLVIVLRPSGIIQTNVFDIKRLLRSVSRGFFQAVLLIFLTALFGSTYQLDLMLATIFLTTFITLTVISRTFSIYFCSWLEHALDTIQIEYATPGELNAIRTILSGMPCVLIHNTTLGCKHAEGNRLDQRLACSNHAAPSPTPRWKPKTSTITALLSGMFVIGIMMSLFLTVMLPAPSDDYFRQYKGFVFFWLVVLFMVGLVVEKVYSDIEFVETQLDYTEVKME